MKQLQFLNILGIATATSVFVATPAEAQIAQVTGVRLNPTPAGLEIILETEDGSALQAFSASYGRVFIADVITTQLRLREGKAFRADNPAQGISFVEVTPLDANSIRVKVVSSQASLPTAQVLTRGRNLVLSFSGVPGTTAVRPAPGTTLTPPGVKPGVPSPGVPPTGPGAIPGAVVPSIPTPSEAVPGAPPPGVPPTRPSATPGSPGAPQERVPTTRPSREPGAVVPSVPPTRPSREPGAVVPSIPPSRPPARTATDEPTELIVVADPEGYRVPEATTATRTETPIRDVPASIQVVPQQVLEDQQIVQLRDALRNVSGVTQSGNYGGTGAGSFNIRGFAQDITFRNGFRNSDFYTISETANVERIEVLKGPASVLFGQTQPGGIVNLVTKQPLSEPYYSVEFTAGQFSFYRPSIDISGPLNSDRTLLYRLNVAYQNSGSFRDYVNTERFFIAPVVTWKIGDNTTLTVDFEYLYDDPVFDRGITALNDGSFVLPINRFLGYPKLDDYYTTTLRGGYTFEHRFSENWRVRNALSIRSDGRFGSRADIGSGLRDDGLLGRALRVDDIVNENYGIQTELTGNFATGSIKHQLLTGLELNRRTDFGRGQRAELPPIDIFNPNYDIERPTELSDPFGRSLTRIDTLGVYIQDQVTILDNLKLLIGGRFDSSEQSDRNFTFGTSSSQSDEAFSPRIGIVYQPIQPISLYASYSRSFLPQIGRSATNTPFNPERGTQYEVGIKADITDTFSATFAVYQITKSNVLTSDPQDPDFSIQIGEQRSRGVELDVAGEILPGLRIIATYAYTDAKITEDNVYPVGSQLFNVPEHTASLWTTYEIQNGSFRGLGFGVGLFYVSDRPRDPTFDPPGFELPSYLRTDAVVYYRRSNWQAQINFKNLFDNKYYETSQGYDIIYPGAPFNVTGTIRWEF